MSVALRVRAMMPGSIAVDSVALITTSVLTAVTGIAFWTVVARMIPPHELGVQTALLSLMTMAGTVAASGAGNAMTAMIPVTPAPKRARLLRQAALVVLVGSALAGGVAGTLGAFTIDQHVSPATILAMVAAGSMIMAFFAFKDTVLTALSVARRLPALNMAGAIVKIALVPLLLWGAVAHAAVVATLSASVLTCVVAVVLVRRAIDREVPAGEFVRDHSRRQLIGFAVRDGTAGLISMGPLLGAPFLVTWLAGPVDGAVL
ncbi:MAG: oligosaccharide flippase family protein, partial [Actinomycetota bacterium]|nr:oligosaccharide flippase family protein [Actinomycetota bacterium]